MYGRATQHLISAKQQVASLGGSRKTSRISADDAEELKTIESNLQQAEAVLKRGSIGEKAKLYLKKTSSTTAATTDALSKVMNGRLLCRRERTNPLVISYIFKCFIYISDRLCTIQCQPSIRRLMPRSPISSNSQCR